MWNTSHGGTKGWIVWDKGQHGLTMSDCELAYTSFDVPTRIVVMNRVELLKDGTFHPTQKPVKLYEWVISRYAKEGDKILDTHAGSGACLIAAHRTQHEFLGFEIDADYFQKASERIKAEQAQMTIFDFIGGGMRGDERSENRVDRCRRSQFPEHSIDETICVA